MLQVKHNNHHQDEFVKTLNTQSNSFHEAPEQVFEDFLSSQSFLRADLKQQKDDAQAMREVTERIRAQVRCIIRSLRGWQERHSDYDNTMRLRYSAYEGALCYSDLRRHWAYYRHAMGELKRMRQHEDI